MDDSVKRELVRKALAEGLIDNGPRWLDSLEEPMPAWAVLDIAVRLLEKLNPPGESYD